MRFSCYESNDWGIQKRFMVSWDLYQLIYWHAISATNQEDWNNDGDIIG